MSTKTDTKVKVEKQLNACECGCGESTARRFAPGHDAKLKSRMIKLFRSGDAGYRADAEDIAALYGWQHFLTEKPQRKSQAKSAKTQREVEFRSVKVGRWEYPVVGTVRVGKDRHEVTYVKRDGSTATATVTADKLAA